MIGVRKLMAGFLSCGLSIAFVGTATYASGSGPRLTPDQAVHRLQQGNARFIAGESTHPNTGADRMADTTKNGQQPFATIITCSDSRVPVERLFDQGIGDTFVIRVAGNVCDVDEIGSIEYGVDHLATPVLVVLGHTNCGAVTAVVTDAKLHGSIPSLVDNIKPAIERARKNHPHLRGKALVPEAVKANVWQSIDDLFKSSPATRERVQGGKLKVVGALYDIGNGKVEWLGSHPEQGRLLAYAGGPSAEGGHGGVDAAGGGHGEVQAAGHTNEVSAEDEAAVAAMIRKLESRTTVAKHEKTVTSTGYGSTLLYLFGGLVLVVTGGLVFFYARAQDQHGNTHLRWTLGAKLIGGFSVIIIALTGMAIYSIDAMNGIGAEIEELAEEIIPLTDAVAMIEVDQLQQAVALERAFRFGEQEGAHAEEKFQESVERFEELAQKVDKELADVLTFLEEVPVYDEEQAEVVAEAMNTLAKIEVEHASFEALAEKAIELIGEDKHGQARLLEEHIEQSGDQLDHELEQYLIALQKRMEEASHTAEKDEQRAVTMMMGAAIASVLIGLCLALWLTRSITKPVNRIIAGLNEGADQVNDAAAQVSAASQQSAEGASEQASSLEETSSALEQMAAMTRTNAENAKQANELSGQARAAAEGGDKTMHRLNEAMIGISEASGQISKIIKVIEEIAFQTNLLALNAAVEAARAGEHGKGFAVVADEVRNLAQRAAQAARETTGLIEDSASKAKEGTDVAAEVGKALSAIVGDVSKVTDLVDGITKASEEQAQGVDQVNTAVSQMDKVTQQNASGAEESAAAAEELSAQAQQVKGMVGELMALVNGGTAQGVTTAAPNSPGRSTAGYAQKKPHPVRVGAPAGGHQEESPRTGGGSSDDEFMALDSKGNKGLKEF